MSKSTPFTPRQMFWWGGAILAVAVAAFVFITDEMAPEPQDCTPDALQSHAPFVTRFNDSAKRAAASTPQALGDVVNEMKTTRESYSKISATGCAKQAQMTMLGVMDKVISAEARRQSNDPQAANQLRDTLQNLETASKEFQNALNGTPVP